MRITDILRINISKLRYRTGRALFLIVPIMILVLLTVVVSSHADNFRNAASSAIIGTAEQQNTVIKLEMTSDASDPRAFFESQSETYSEVDLANISTIENVELAQLEVSLPIDNVVITDLFEQEIDISSLVGLEPELAALYTSEEFNYQEGEAIPVILNASTFIESYQDWGNQIKVTVEVQRGRGFGEPGAEVINNTPIKSEAISYLEEDLIGKEITLEVRSLEEIQNYEVEFEQTGLTYTKLTDGKINNQIKDRKDSIQKYWKYSELTAPITYTFKVVGVIESEGDSSTYIPTQAAEQLSRDYFQREISARRNKEVPLDKLNAVYNGLSFDGTAIELDVFAQATRNARFGAQGNAVFRGGGFGRPQELSRVDINFEEVQSYEIPGLVVRVDADTDEVKNRVSKPEVFNKSVKSSRIIWIKVDDVKNRDEVVKTLNNAGYPYQDFSSLEVFGSIDKNLQLVSNGLSVAFAVIGIGVIILTMSKFVSDSKKEIGILRAMGMSKGIIRFMFISQAGLYTLTGYVVGLGLGIVSSVLLAPIVSGWFDSAVISALGESFEVIQTVDASTFTQISKDTILIYSGMLLLITLVISLIPANRAAGISPVEAIKGE